MVAGARDHPQSRGRLRLTGPNPDDRIEILAGTLSDPDDLEAAVASVRTCRELAGSDPLRPFIGRQLMPTSSDDDALKSRASASFSPSVWSLSYNRNRFFPRLK